MSRGDDHDVSVQQDDVQPDDGVVRESLRSSPKDLGPGRTR